MPDVKQVYEMVTKQRPPDAGALERQRTRQIRTMRNRRVGAFVVAAAIAVLASAVVLGMREARAPIDVGTDPTVTPRAATVGTVTFDGSTCSMDITAERIEPGAQLFEVVNTADRRVMIDSYELSDGYTFRAFRTVVEQTRRFAEAGKQQSLPTSAFWPELEGPERQATYIGSDVVPANSSETIVTTMYTGRHALVCLQRYDNPPRSLRGFAPFGIIGPLDVG